MYWLVIPNILGILTESIQRFLYSSQNLKCVMNIFNYFFDDEEKAFDFLHYCVFDAIGMILTDILIYRLSLLL